MRALILLAWLCCTSAMAERTARFEDTYGYTVFDTSTNRCVSAPVDITASGTPLDLVATEPDGNADDEGSVVLSLTAPFEYYGTAVEAVTASSNGYLALGGAVDTENGGDFSNDCPLPAVPDNASPASGRIYPLHDDLVGAGQLHTEYFDSCPRPSGTSVDGACTVIQWTQWQTLGAAKRFTFQVLLYHASAAIAVQYVDIPAAALAGATLGLQNENSTSGATIRCNSVEAQSPVQGFCAYDPRFPSLVVLDTVFADGFQE